MHARRARAARPATMVFSPHRLKKIRPRPSLDAPHPLSPAYHSIRTRNSHRGLLCRRGHIDFAGGPSCLKIPANNSAKEIYLSLTTRLHRHFVTERVCRDDRMYVTALSKHTVSGGVAVEGFVRWSAMGYPWQGAFRFTGYIHRSTIWPNGYRYVCGEVGVYNCVTVNELESIAI